MHDLPANTMLTYLSNPMFDKVDFSALPVSTLAAEIERFKTDRGGNPAPETDALTFYFMNHAFHVMKSRHHPLETLDKDMAFVAEQHIRNTNLVAKRLFCYSVVIAVEEARFMHQQEPAFYDFLERSYGAEFRDYVKNGFQAKSQKGGRDGLTSFGALDMTCGQFATAMVSVFAFAKWSPGFGGKGWVPIAALVADCVHGNISFESMADQAFSLCHNNGSMFNKGHFYSHYTHFIYDILDIQDSGQIPQWISSNSTSKFLSGDLKKVHGIMAERFPDEMTGRVNSALITNSKQKREQKASMLAKKNAATWNAMSHQTHGKPQKAQPSIAMDGVLLSGLKKNGML